MMNKEMLVRTTMLIKKYNSSDLVHMIYVANIRILIKGK